jgi:hypothetical protein
MQTATLISNPFVKTSSSRQKPIVSTTAPEGYMTGDEFERSVKTKLYNYYKENGLL